MHIAYLLDHPLPSTATDTEQAVRTVAALSRQGHTVTLVVPTPHDAPAPSPEQIRTYYQTRGDFDVEAMPTIFARFMGARKPIHGLRSVRSRSATDADVLYTRNIPSLLTAAMSGRPFVYETYRPWADERSFLGPVFRRVMAKPAFVGAILHSNLARSRYCALGIDSEKLEVVHNAHEPSHFEPRLERDEARRRLGIDLKQPLVVYAGRVSPKKGLDTVLAMASRCEEATFLLVGSEGLGPIERAAREQKNVIVSPWVRVDRMVEYLFAADVLVQPPSSAPLEVAKNTVLPMKLFHYLAAGRPIVAPSTADVTELLEHDVNAALVEPGDIDAAVRAVRRLLANAAFAKKLARGGLETAKGASWDARADRIQRFVTQRMAAAKQETVETALLRAR